MSTTIGFMELTFDVVQASSLKDKRRAVKSFKDRVRHRHNVSIAEVDGQDNHRRAVLAVSMVGNDHRYIEGVLQQIVNAAEMHRDMILLATEVSWL